MCRSWIYMLLAVILNLALALPAVASISIVADLDSNATNGPDTLQIEPTDTVLVYLWFTGSDSIHSYGVTLGDTAGALSWVEETAATIYNSPSGWTNTSVQQDSLGWLLLQATDFTISTPIQVPYEFARLKFYVTPGDSCGTMEWNPDLSGWFNSDVGESTFVAFESPTICVDSVLDGGEDGGSEGSPGGEDAGVGPSFPGAGEGVGFLRAEPFRIIENRGQLPEGVLYYLPVTGGTVFFTSTGMVADLVTGSTPLGFPVERSHHFGLPPEQDTFLVEHLVMKTGFAGISGSFEVEGAGELAGKMNFYKGNDPSNWHVGVPSYSEITYRDLYPGIDLSYYQSDGILKYDFIVQPGADPSRIEMEYSGVSEIGLSESGDLEIETDRGTLLEERPYLYQTNGNEEIAVTGSYQLRGENKIGFHISEYDTILPLVIDPGLVWSTYLGGSEHDEGWAVSFDSLGNVVVTGRTNSPDYPGTTGVFIDTFSGSWDAYVTKLSSTGDELIFSTFLGGEDADGAYGLAVDPDSDIFLAGETASEDFPIAEDLAWQSTKGDGKDAFFAKLSSSGQLLYSSFYGPSGNDQEAWDLALEPDGSVLIAGYSVTSYLSTNQNVMVARFKPDTQDPNEYDVSASYVISGNDWDAAWGVDIGPDGKPYLVGETWSSDFPHTFPSSGGSGLSRLFITRLYDHLNAVDVSRTVGVESLTVGTDISVSPSGEVTVCGITQSRFLFSRISAPYPIRCLSGYDDDYNDAFTDYWWPRADAFIMKWTEALDTLICGTYLGGDYYDGAFGVDVDQDGKVLLTGASILNFPAGFSPPPPDSLLNRDVFIAKLDSGLKELKFSRLMDSGAWGDEFGLDIANSENGGTAICGVTSPDTTPPPNEFEVTFGAYDTTYNREGDAFAAVFDIIDCGSSDVSVETMEDYAASFSLTSRPNPFNPKIRISFNVEREAGILLQVFDSRGRLSATIDRGVRSAGHHWARWDGTDDSGRSIPAGMYFLRLSIGENTTTRKILLVR